VTGSVVVTGLASMVTDPDNDPLIFYTTDTDVVFDDQNPGTFTWTPTTELRHGAAVPGAPHTHTIVITADDGNGGTYDITVVVPIDPQNAEPTVIVSPPSAPVVGSGTVTGSITATDGDSDELTFFVDGATATDTNTFITAGGATLIIDPTTGTYTYTPSGAQQLAASYINATTDDTGNHRHHRRRRTRRNHQPDDHCPGLRNHIHRPAVRRHPGRPRRHRLPNHLHR
ncbi:MAG: hypothetical protein IDH24_08665, partial [Gordonia sp.]|nr:hypothetical protein [Gordonia sp. (in: high G+C Gram-positive bacteria)]